MPFIGNQPAEKYSAFTKQDFSTSATTSYTLSQAVANENEIALFINFVRQEPTTAYTASGTSLTLTSATSGSDDMYCVYLGKAVQTVNPPNSSVGSSQVSADLITGQTALGATPADTDELLISDAGTLKRVDYSYLKSANTPAFFATTSAQQTITNQTDTKIQFATEVIDTDNCYDPSTNYRFTPTTAGKYFCYLVTSLETSGGVSTANYAFLKFKKNGSLIYQSYQDNSNNNGFAIHLTVNAIIDMNGSSDYLEGFVNSNASSGSLKVQTGEYSLFGAYKLIGA